MKSATTKQILEAAVRVASSPGGWSKLTRETVARAAGCSDALVSVHFGTMTVLRRDIMRHAIRARCLPIIAQGVAAGDKRAVAAPDALKREALATLTATA